MSSPRLLFTAGIFLLSSVFTTSACADIVTGKVVGPDGKPVPGAKIVAIVFSAESQPGKIETKTLTSDAQGTFSLDVPPIPDPKEKNPPIARVCIAAPGFGLAQTYMTLHPSDNNTVHLENGVTLRGKVIDTAGKPVPGVDVRFQSFYVGGSRGNGTSYLWLAEEEKAIPGLIVKTGVNGVWAIADIPATATQSSVVLADSKYVQIALDIPVNAAADSQIVARPAAVVVGKVAGADGKPRAGITVSARQENYGVEMADTITDADGGYRLTGLPTGGFAIWVSQEQTGVTLLPAEVAAPLRQIAVTEGKETIAPNLVLTPGGLV